MHHTWQRQTLTVWECVDYYCLGIWWMDIELFYGGKGWGEKRLRVLRIMWPCPEASYREYLFRHEVWRHCYPQRTLPTTTIEGWWHGTISSQSWKGPVTLYQNDTARYSSTPRSGITGAHPIINVITHKSKQLLGVGDLVSWLYKAKEISAGVSFLQL